MEEIINNEWRLESIRIDFEYGYNFHSDPVKKEDRYEGMITFKNGDCELFTLKVKPGMAQRYIDLIANDIVLSATELGEKLKESLGLK